MQRLHGLWLCVLLLSGPVWGKHWHEDQDDWSWHVQHQHQNDSADYCQDKSCYFESHDRRVISEYYASRYPPPSHSPESKFRRNGQLPPGWETRMELMPVEVERQLVPVPVGYRRGIIYGFAVVYSLQFGVIIDVTPLFGRYCPSATTNTGSWKI